MSSYKERVARAVNNELWQEFRLALKGRPTKEKLALLRDYYEEGFYHRTGPCTVRGCVLPIGPEAFEDCKIRIDNYIKALCRGGQLYPGESLETALANGWDLRIKS